MRALLVGGLLALCVFLAAASSSDRSKSGNPPKSNRATEVAAGSDKSGVPKKKCTGCYSVLAEVAAGSDKSGVPKKKCTGCYSVLAMAPVVKVDLTKPRSSRQTEGRGGKKLRSIRADPSDPASSRRRKKCPGCYSALITTNDGPLRVVRQSEDGGEKKRKRKPKPENNGERRIIDPIGRSVLPPETPESKSPPLLLNDGRLRVSRQSEDGGEKKRKPRPPNKGGRRINTPIGRSVYPPETPESKSPPLLLNDEPSAAEEEKEEGRRGGKRKHRRGKKNREEERITPGSPSDLGAALPPQGEPSAAGKGRRGGRGGRRKDKGGKTIRVEEHITPGSLSILAMQQNPQDELTAVEKPKKSDKKGEKRNKGKSGMYSPMGRNLQPLELTDLDKMMSAGHLPPGSAEEHNPFGASSSRGRRHHGEGRPWSHRRRHRGEEQRKRDDTDPTTEHPEESEREGRPWKHGRRHGGGERRRWWKKEDTDPTTELLEESEREGRPWKHGRRHGGERRRWWRKEDTDPTTEHPKETEGEGRPQRHERRHRGEERRRGRKRDDTDPTTEVKEEERRQGRGHRHRHDSRQGEWRSHTGGRSLIMSSSFQQNLDAGGGEKETDAQA